MRVSGFDIIRCLLVTDEAIGDSWSTRIIEGISRDSETYISWTSNFEKEKYVNGKLRSHNYNLSMTVTWVLLAPKLRGQWLCWGAHAVTYISFHQDFDLT